MSDTSHKLFVSLFLGTALVLFSLRFMSAPTQAAGVDYKSSWKATRLLQVTSGTSPYSSTRLSAAVGVAEWEVTGVVAGGDKRFREVWTIPGGRTVTGDLGRLVDTESCFGGECIKGIRRSSITFTGGSETRYLTGFNGNGRFSVSTVPVDGAYQDASGLSRIILNEYRSGAINRAVSCGMVSSEVFAGNTVNRYGWNVGPYVYCMRASGSYGFEFEAQGVNANLIAGGSPVNIGGGNHSLPTTVGAGVVMPLEWTINGFLCEDPADKRCDAVR